MQDVLQMPLEFGNTGQIQALKKLEASMKADELFYQFTDALYCSVEYPIGEPTDEVKKDVKEYAKNLFECFDMNCRISELKSK